MLFDDPVTLDWSEKQRAYLESHPNLQYLLAPFKGGVHFRPLGEKNELVGIWTYNVDVEEGASVPDAPHIDEYYGEIVIRALSNFVPGLKQYVGTAENPLSSSNPNIVTVKAGHYCKTSENRPFIGRAWADDPRVLLLGCLSGFGIMTAPAAGELIAAHTLQAVNGGNTDAMPLPSYANEFVPARYQDATYLEKVEKLGGNTGQL